MSRRDARKAIAIRLPEELRRALVRRSADRRPLAFLLRGAVVAALCNAPGRVAGRGRGTARPILLQLAETERRALEAIARDSGLGPEETAIALAWRAVRGGMQDQGAM